MPKFSVIISVYNKGKYIKKTLESVLNQSIQDFEICIVNDGSRDNSESIINKIDDSRIHYHYQKNKGASAGRNLALKNSTGDYKAFLDADDLWDEDHLLEIEKLIQLFPLNKVFSTSLKIEDSTGIYPATYDIPNQKYQSLNFFKNSLADPILSGSTTVIHKSIMEEIGIFDENISSGQDTDYWIRIGLKYDVAFSKKITAIYTFVPNSLSQKKFEFHMKIEFSKFDKLAIDNKPLAKFIAYNRLSFWVKCLSVNDKKNASLLKKKINKRLLTKNQQFILLLNSWQIKLLLTTKEILKKIGMRPKLFRR